MIYLGLLLLLVPLPLLYMVNYVKKSSWASTRSGVVVLVLIYSAAVFAIGMGLELLKRVVTNGDSGGSNIS